VTFVVPTQRRTALGQSFLYVPIRDGQDEELTR